MQRFIIPASVVAILISLAALVILLAAGANTPQNVTDTQQDGAQAEEPGTAPTPEQETEQGTDQDGLAQPQEDPAADDEQPLGEGLNNQEDQPSGEDQPLGGEQANQEDQTPGEDQPLGDAPSDQEGPTGQEDQAANQGDQATQQGAQQPGPATATVRVGGDAAFYCTLGVIGNPETTQGQSPASYEVQVETDGTALDTVMATCQKISPGTLGVQIRYDGEVVARDRTDAQLGTVSVSWNPLTEE